MKSILLPTDFSVISKNAIHYALALFRDDDCIFYFMNSFDIGMTSPTAGVSSKSFQEAVYKSNKMQSETDLATLLSEIDNQYDNPKHQFKTLSLYMGFELAVKKSITNLQIDYVVMGAKGATGLKEVAIGSNTAGIIGKITCPLLVIPENALFLSLSELVLATDYEITYSLKGIQPFLEFVHPKAQISVLYVNETGSELNASKTQAKHELQTLLSKYKNEHYMLTQISMDQGARIFAESRNVDMFCVIAKKHNFLHRFFGKSYSKMLTRHTRIPLLILNYEMF